MIPFLQVDDRRISVELFEDMICACVFRELSDRPVFVCCVTERNRARWAGSGAGCREFVRPECALLGGRTILCLANPLHAERALFHHAFSADGDVGIQLPVERLGKRVLWPRRLTVTKPVEVANLV